MIISKTLRQVEILFVDTAAEFPLFGSALNTYYAASRDIAREILHVIFFVPRGSSSKKIFERMSLPSTQC